MPRRAGPACLRVVGHRRDLYWHRPSVKWLAPVSGATPFVANLKLTVVDRFQTTDGSGLPIAFEHRVEKTFTVKVTTR